MGEDIAENDDDDNDVDHEDAVFPHDETSFLFLLKKLDFAMTLSVSYGKPI